MKESLLTYGPDLERNYLTAGLDYYKPTMSQLAYEKHPETEVTFTFKNRGEQRLADYVDSADLQKRFDTIMQNGFSPEELDYLAGLMNSDGTTVFKQDYINYLTSAELPQVEVTIEDGDIAVQTKGAWNTVTFWETVVMSEINEAYFESYVRKNNLDINEIYEEGDRRLSQKIATLQANPDIKFADFGTRRHFSYRWQKYVLERLAKECPGNLLGTSNVALANGLGLKPIGTFAHEMPMVYAGLADAHNQDVMASHNQFLDDWFDYYGTDLSVALTDTFTSDFFFEDFTPDQAETWKGLRHDSGDPVDFGERAVDFYKQQDIDPLTKTIIFSDGLDIDEIVRLHNHFKGRINVVFGWGTSLTNDMPIETLNIVMKATHTKDMLTGQEADNVKLSDNEGKHTGAGNLVERYQQIFGQQVLAA